MKDKLKLDFKKEEPSPYIIDLREKEKKEFNLLPFTEIFKKILIFFSFGVVIFVQIFFVWFTYLEIEKIKKEILSEDFLLENFFDGLIALKNLDFSSAKEKLILAEEKFFEKIKKINQANLIVKIFIRFHPKAKTSLALINGFYDSARLGNFLIKTIEELPLLFKNEEIVETEKILPAEILSINFLTKIDFLQKRTKHFFSLIEKIEKNLSKVSTIYLPLNFRSSFELIKKQLPVLKKKIDDFDLILENLEKIVGKNSFKRYLILFQNNNEIRATGGFLGTYALIDFLNGKIRNFEMPAGGTYDLAGQLTVKVAPPKPFLIAYPKWQFHDANWFPDWPTSAKKLIWFYEKSGGPTVDGVIAINAELIPEILKVIGEIQMSEYGKVLNQENFILEIQKTIEKERKEEKKPKQILVDLTPILIRKILALEPNNFFEIIKIIFRGLEEKKILFYFSDQSIQKFFQEKNLTGEIKESPFDYLMVVVSNVNGTKTEGKISQKIFYQAEVDKDGSIISTLTVKRKHQGEKNEPFFGRNDLSWLRLYLPKGAIFLGVKGQTKKDFPKPKDNFLLDEDLKKIENEILIDKFSQTRITEEFNKTCLGNFLEVAPGEEKEISFKYFLPFKLDLNKEIISYSLLIQKQPGRESEFEGEIILPTEKNIIWLYPKDEIKKEGKVIKISSIINRDKIFAFILGPTN